MLDPNNRELRSILDWVTLEYNPNLFVSVQIPHETKTPDQEIFETHIRKIAKWTEKDLLGQRWINKHYRFVCFCETGHSGTWHAHLLLACPDRNIDEVSTAFASAGKKYQKQHNTEKAPDINIKPIDDIEGLFPYCVKELGIERLEHIQSNRIVLCEHLFNRYSTRRKRLTL